MIKVRVYRPFCKEKFIASLPKSTKFITVLDRTIENGSEAPLYLDCTSALNTAHFEGNIFSGIYGLGGKEFSPAQVHTIFANMGNNGKANFTVGINDDAGNSSLKIMPYQTKQNRYEIKIFGLGSDGSSGFAVLFPVDDSISSAICFSSSAIFDSYSAVFVCWSRLSCSISPSSRSIILI